MFPYFKGKLPRTDLEYSSLLIIQGALDLRSRHLDHSASAPPIKINPNFMTIYLCIHIYFAQTLSLVGTINHLHGNLCLFVLT